jgi:hypothetical protein
MSLTTARLDELAEADRLTSEAWGIEHPGEYAELITKARLQVAIDELPLPENWELRIGNPVGTPYATAFSRRTGDQESAYAPTMLAAVLELDAALRSRA